MAKIYPTKVNIDQPWKREPIEPVESLRPKTGNDVLLIVGDATCVMKDLAKFYDLSVPHDTLCINHSALIFLEAGWPFEHYVCGDSHMRQMQKLALEIPDNVIKHCWNAQSPGFQVRWIKHDNRGWNGTTANLAVKLALTLDYLRLVLAGCPMDKSGHWYDNSLPENDTKRLNDHRHHLWFWTEMATRPAGKFIRSMSGNTKQLFGEPTREWLLNV